MELACPHCSARFSFEPTTTITPDSPEMELLMDGILNCVECPSCKKNLSIPLRLIYRDPENALVIIQEPKAMEMAQARAAALQADEAATTAARNAGTQRPTVRMVFGRPEFIEKIQLFENDYDDRVIEYAKYQLFNGGVTDGELSPAKHRLFFDFTRSDDDQLTFIVFTRDTGRPVRLLQVDMHEYDQLLDELENNPAAAAELEHIFPGAFVDVDTIFFDQRQHAKSTDR